MANSIDPDQIAPLEQSDMVWVCTVCICFFVKTLQVYKIVGHILYLASDQGVMEGQTERWMDRFEWINITDSSKYHAPDMMLYSKLSHKTNTRPTNSDF